MSADNKYVLVTGTNSGLGLGICTRLIDDFLKGQPKSTSLTVIFTTRSTRKGNETLQTIQAHLTRNHPAQARRRIHLQPENVDLTSLLSVHALARKLIASDIPKLDSIILNAGIAGWSGLDWPLAVWTILCSFRTSTTWPRFKLGMAGLVTEKQFPVDTQTPTNQSEPPLGQIFCANVFGHYMLVHWLMPVIRACTADSPGKIIWVSSIEPQARHLNEEDIQSIKSHAGYEGTKRLADTLALTYNQPITSEAVSTFTNPSSSLSPSDPKSNRRPNLSRPSMHTTQPGVLTTTIIALYWIVHQAYFVAILISRVLGSPWATLSPYPAALAMTWLSLAPLAEINDEEAKLGHPDVTTTTKQNQTKTSGRVKWGTATTWSGQTSVKPTEVEHWGLNGSGTPYVQQWWAGKLGRAPETKEATREDVDEFVAQGARLWRAMEDLRRDWEMRIDGFEKEEKQKTGTKTK